MGRVVAATNPAMIGSELGRTYLVEDPVTVQARNFFDIQSDILSGGQNEAEVKHTMTAESLIDPDKRFRGIIVGRIAVDSIREVVVRILHAQAMKGHGRKTLEFQIMDGSGRVIVDSDHKEGEPVDLLALDVTSARAAASGESGFVQEEHGRRHVAVVTGYAPMPSKRGLKADGWYILIRLDNESILGEVYPWSTRIVILSSLAGLILTLTLLWSVLQLQRHRNDAEAAKQVALEARGRAEQLYNEKQALLTAAEVFFVRLTASGAVSEWAIQAEKLLGISHTEAIGSVFLDLSIDWNREAISRAIDQVSQTLITVHLAKVRVVRRGNLERFLKLTLSPLANGTTVEIVLMGEDITEHLLLEQELAQAHKLESIGQLAAGIAHEINTPIQFIGDNIRFLSDSFASLLTMVGRTREWLACAESGTWAPDMVESYEAEMRQVDLRYLTEEIPKAIAQSVEGVRRVANIVRSMKDFAHPGCVEMTNVNLNAAIESTVTVAHNEWKYVADLTTDLASDLPPVPCLFNQFNQAMLNMIVNAAHAIGDMVKGTGQKGRITITTRSVGEWAEIRIADTGAGIPDAIRHRIFDPFFTTKGVGKGTGQGLAITRSVVVDKHRGQIMVESEAGKGSTFIVRLPLREPTEPTALENTA